MTAGAGPDAVPTHDANARKAYDVPDKELRLRLVSGMAEKRNKFEAYRRNGIVNSDDVCVVAINGAMLSVHADFFPPRLVRALFEFGWPQIKVDLETREVVERGYSHQVAVQKMSGSPVGQGMFRDGSCTSVSAAIYSAASYAFAGSPLGCDFVLVHNPTAVAPLKRELVSIGNEFWIDGENLSSKRHGERDQAS